MKELVIIVLFVVILFVGSDGNKRDRPIMYSNSMEAPNYGYTQMYDSNTKTYELHVKFATEELQSSIKTMLDTYWHSVDEMRLKLIEQEKYSFFESTQNYLEQIRYLKDVIEEQKHNISIFRIASGDFDLGRPLFLNSNETERDLLIASMYNKNISNVEIVIEFLNSFSDNKTIIHGYRLLFDQMIKNQHIYSAPTTTIAYRVFVDFNQNYENNENLNYLKLKLPQSLKDFHWNQIVVIRNSKFNKDIFTIVDNTAYYHDNLRNIPFLYSHTSDTSEYSLAHYLYPISNGKYFHIKSRRGNAYLFADTNEFAYDNDRRAVFGWRRENETKETGKWQFEPIEGSQKFKIKNIYWNEYLSVAEGLLIRDEYYKLITLRSGKCEDDYCKWNFHKYTGT